MAEALKKRRLEIAEAANRSLHVQRAEDTPCSEIQVGNHRVGGEVFSIIAGPCSVESPEQIEFCSEFAAKCGVHILRGGCFKGRTSPYSFQGLGFDGLKLLSDAGKKVGLPIVSEILQPAHVEPMAAQTDLLQIGARNMQNYPLLQEVGKASKPVLLKRGISASIKELLLAAEYIAASGNSQIILCERGIRTFESSTRYTLDISAIPVLRKETHLPVIVDPSHAAGNRDYVPALARAAYAAGADGVMIEFHPNPEEALSDGPQALRPETLLALSQELCQPSRREKLA